MKGVSIMTETDKQKENKTKKTKTTTPGRGKRKHQLTKDEVLEILNIFETNRDLTPDDISKNYGCSVSQVNKVIYMIRNNEWKPKQENDSLPKGYMFPKTIKEVVESVMFDKGFVRGE